MATIHISEETKELIRSFVVMRYGSSYHGKMTQVIDAAIKEYIKKEGKQ